MNSDSVGRWRTSGVQEKMVYIVTEDEFGCVGNCWMKDRLFVGDLVTPIRLAGDCFYYYQLLGGGSAEHRGLKKGFEQYSLVLNGVTKQPVYRIFKGATFGAYAFAVPYEFQPTVVEWHKLMGGEEVEFSNRIDVEKVQDAEAKASEAEDLATVDAAVASYKKDLGL